MEQDQSKPVEQEQEVVGVVEPSPATETTVAKQTLIYIAPIPDAESFKKYERVLNGAADRIITMAEKAQQKDIDNSRRRLDIEEKRLRYTTTTSIFIIVASTIALLHGEPILAGTGLGISMIGMIVRLYFIGTEKADK